MTPENLTILDDVVQNAALELFDAYRFPVTPTGPAIPPPERKARVELAAVIGFVADQARGNLTIATSAPVLRASSPAGGIHDWLGEVSNQLLGRIKNKLAPYGLSIDVTPPLVVASGEVSVGGMRSDTVRMHTLSSSEGNLQLWLRIQLEESVVLAYQHELENVAAKEGDLLLF